MIRLRITALTCLCFLSGIVAAQKKKAAATADIKETDSVVRFIGITGEDHPCVNDHELVLQIEAVKGTHTDICILYHDPAQGDTNFSNLRILDITTGAPSDTLKISLLLNSSTYPHGIYRLALVTDSNKKVIAHTRDIIKDYCACFEVPEKVQLQGGKFTLNCGRELRNFSFHLYSSVGFEVFSTNSYNFEWNMLYLGAPVSPGIYYYSASFEEPSVFGNKTKQPAGSITIIP